MSENPFQAGYFAGVVNEIKNPHPFWSGSHASWAIGNWIGRDVHCAVVEAVYLHGESSK